MIYRELYYIRVLGGEKEGPIFIPGRMVQVRDFALLDSVRLVAIFLLAVVPSKSGSIPLYIILSNCIEYFS
jgi:hypothetical protein